MKLQLTLMAGIVLGLLLAQAIKSAAILIPVLGLVTGLALYKLKKRNT